MGKLHSVEELEETREACPPSIAEKLGDYGLPAVTTLRKAGCDLERLDGAIKILLWDKPIAVSSTPQGRANRMRKRHERFPEDVPASLSVNEERINRSEEAIILPRPLDSTPNPLSAPKINRLQQRTRTLAKELRALHRNRLVRHALGYTDPGVDPSEVIFRSAGNPIQSVDPDNLLNHFDLPHRLERYANQFLPVVLQKIKGIGLEPDFDRRLLSISVIVQESINEHRQSRGEKPTRRYYDNEVSQVVELFVKGITPERLRQLRSRQAKKVKESLKPSQS